MSDELCLQERYAPNNACFGCGPANAEGLRIRSFPTDDDADAEVVATWTPSKHHEAFEGMLNGGIIGALLDCHSNWTAAWHLMKRSGEPAPPCTVTADFHVRMRKPTPSDVPVSLSARPAKTEGSKVVVEATLSSGDTVTATCTGTFVAVKPGHPAYHRW
ncbi:MAG: PaaI family thioesterase [Acidobacteria bacterium]|nr:PaaI family thioesterase [Acidobacteriota bacterium]NIQ30647.1 PaaI family thioesterase [Acidobacteriota bacterium]NIQ85605.1 PaaI family thioesterase [Acidobacteriota bacterium]